MDPVWIMMTVFVAVLVTLVVYFVRRDAAAKRYVASHPEAAPQPTDPGGILITGISYHKGLQIYVNAGTNLGRKLGTSPHEGTLEISRTRILFTAHTRMSVVQMVMLGHFGLVGFAIDWLVRKVRSNASSEQPAQETYQFAFFRHDIERVKISSFLGMVEFKTMEGKQQFNYARSSKESLTSALQSCGYLEG